MNIGEFKAKRARLVTEAQAIFDTAGKEVRALSQEENEKVSALEKEADGLTATIERAEKMDERSRFLAAPATRSIGAEDTSPLDLSEKDKAQYSILRAINRRASNLPLDGIEKELSDEMAKRNGKNPQGFYVPLEAFSKKRALDTTAGAGTITTALQGFIDLLRSKTFLSQAGATFLTDLQGKIAIPRQSGGATAYWLTEGGSNTASNQTADQMPLTPKTVGAYTDLTRQFISQTSISAEAMVRSDLAQVLARAIETAALTGSGNTGQPKGIANISGVTSIEASGTSITWAEAVSLETAVLKNNVDISNGAYVSNSKVGGQMKTVLRSSVAGATYILDGGRVNNYPFFNTNLVASTDSDSYGSLLSKMYFGNWADLVVGFWNSLDIMVDPYTGSSTGTVRIVALQDVDVNIRHVESFAILADINAQ